MTREYGEQATMAKILQQGSERALRDAAGTAPLFPIVHLIVWPLRKTMVLGEHGKYILATFGNRAGNKRSTYLHLI